MIFKHAFLREEFEDALTRNDAELCGKRRIVEQLDELGNQIGDLTRVKREAAFADDFRECAEIGGDDRKTALHVLCDDQAKDFAPERGRDDHGCPGKGRFKVRRGELTRELNAADEA